MNGNFKNVVFHFDQINAVDEFSIGGDGMSLKVEYAKLSTTRHDDLSVKYGNLDGRFDNVFNCSGVDRGINDVPCKAGVLSIVKNVDALGTV